MGYGQPPGHPPYQQQVIVQTAPQKDVGVAYLLWFFLGMYGGHKFYLGEPGLGVLYLFTLGLCGVGWFVDMFLISGQVQRINQQAQMQAQHAAQQMAPRYY